MTMQQQILEAVARPSYTAVKPKVLAKRMNITSDEDYTEFRTALKALVRAGRVAVGGGSVIRPVDPLGTVQGLFRRAASGLCTVRPHTPTADTGTEIRIREDRARDATNGDEVVVRLTRKASKQGYASGEVLQILSRATKTFVGTYFERDGQAYVRIDGTAFSHSIAVGDPGAKGAKPQDKVVVEMLRFPGPDRERGEGVIVEVLGPLGQPGVDLLTVIRAFGLPEEFPADVLDEARVQAELFQEGHTTGRTDFTNETIITIDPVDARDFDDAVSVTIDPKTKHWILTVHIADVSHFAKPGSKLDTEARKRATSVYLPGRVIPMFPELISNGLASLQEGKLRYVKTARIEYTPGLRVASVEFFNGVIRTAKRFTYEQVSAAYADEAEMAKQPPEIAALLKRMKDLALLLRKRRMKRGSLELTMPEAVLEYDGEGRVSGAHFADNDLSHQVIEEFMLAANVAVAEKLTELNVPFLRRVHPAPNEEKLAAFAEFAEILGYPLAHCEDRFEIQRVLSETATKPERAAVHFALLRSLKQAAYSPIQDEHYALAFPHYCHFTSPIRRYPDLVVHRQLDRLIRTGRTAGNLEELKATGEHCSKMERRAEQAERELVKLKILQHLSTRIGLAMNAVITGVAEYGFFAQAEEFPAEGLVHISSLTDDYYHFDEAGRSLVGSRTKRRFRLGDRVRVVVARVEIPRRMLDLRLDKDQPTNERPEPLIQPKKARGKRQNKIGQASSLKKSKKASPKAAKARQKSAKKASKKKSNKKGK